MTPQAILFDLRNAGWSVAVHNDYQQNGESHTFWLMTKGNLAAKGEGRSDAEALAQLSAVVMALEPPAEKPPEYLTGSIDYAVNWCPRCHHGVTTDDEGKCDECGEWTQAPFDEEDARLSGQERPDHWLPSYQRNPGGPELFLWWWNPTALGTARANTLDLAAVTKALPPKTKVSVLRLLLDMDPDAQRTLLFSNRAQMKDWHDRTRKAEGALELVKEENEKLDEELQQIDDILENAGFERGNAVRDVKQMAIDLDEARVRIDGARAALLKIEDAPGIRGHAALSSAVVDMVRFDPELLAFVVNHIIASRQEAFKSLYPRQWAYGLLLALEERFGFNCSPERRR